MVGVGPRMFVCIVNVAAIEGRTFVAKATRMPAMNFKMFALAPSSNPSKFYTS